MAAGPDGELTVAFLTITDMDTPLGRHGHPQLLALIDYRRQLELHPLHVMAHHGLGTVFFAARWFTSA